jgi:hypothetical protein
MGLEENHVEERVVNSWLLPTFKNDEVVNPDLSTGTLAGGAFYLDSSWDCLLSQIFASQIAWQPLSIGSTQAADTPSCSRFLRRPDQRDRKVG